MSVVSAGDEDDKNLGASLTNDKETNMPARDLYAARDLYGGGYDDDDDDSTTKGDDDDDDDSTTKGDDDDDDDDSTGSKGSSKGGSKGRKLMLVREGKM